MKDSRISIVRIRIPLEPEFGHPAGICMVSMRSRTSAIADQLATNSILMGVALHSDLGIEIRRPAPFRGEGLIDRPGAHRWEARAVE